VAGGVGGSGAADPVTPGSGWNRHRALATHPRIAAAVREHGFGHILECRPTLEAVVACLQSADRD
jgi:uroporphyrinogen-III synthase